jgi:hypothetical protein
MDAYVAYFNQVNQLGTSRNAHIEKAIKRFLASEGFWDLKSDTPVLPSQVRS